MTEWAVTSSVLILVVLALRQCLKGKISLRLQYGLWALVLVRLLLPISFGHTPVSVLNAVEETPFSQVLTVVGDGPDQAVAEPDSSLTLNAPQEQSDQTTHQGQEEMEKSCILVRLSHVLLAVWAVGAVAAALWLAGVNLRFARTLRRSRRLLSVEDCPLPVYVSQAIPTPCLFGLLRPCVYVTPITVSDPTLLRHTLAHELTHFHHRDYLWSALRGVCLALHWYNPLVWLAAVVSSRDGELCCDEATVARLGEDQRAAYGRTLLAVTCQGPSNLLLTATSMTGRGRDIKERIPYGPLARQPSFPNPSTATPGRRWTRFWSNTRASPPGIWPMWSTMISSTWRNTTPGTTSPATLPPVPSSVTTEPERETRSPCTPLPSKTAPRTYWSWRKPEMASTFSPICGRKGNSYHLSPLHPRSISLRGCLPCKGFQPVVSWSRQILCVGR